MDVYQKLVTNSLAISSPSVEKIASIYQIVTNYFGNIRIRYESFVVFCARSYRFIAQMTAINSLYVLRSDKATKTLWRCQKCLSS